MQAQIQQLQRAIEAEKRDRQLEQLKAALEKKVGQALQRSAKAEMRVALSKCGSSNTKRRSGTEKSRV